MKISYNWLKTYLPVDLTPERIAEILTQTGLEVEGVSKTEAIPGGLKGVVIGQVLEKWKHPNADRLSVTKVDLGQDEPVQIVCGAPNVDAGQKVVVATVGSELHPTGGEAFKIKKGKIRGEVSMGMICAEDEIGLGESHDGIMVLEASAQIGMPAGEYFQLDDDYTIEIGLTPNRTDGMSHIGVARDLRAALRNMADVDEADPGTVQWPSVADFPQGDGSFEIPVEVRSSERCPRYAGVSISGVEVKASPDWLQERLRSIGLAPINNVVDITNFVLHETGQPLHAFDADRITGGKVVVDTLSEGTPFRTLDEVERKLSSEDLMICDAEGNGLCIAGVFGGISSGVSEDTKRVFLESACFNPVSVRKTAKRHGLNTDASFRFERGVDPRETLYALKRAALLICEVAGGQITSGVTDIYPNPIEPRVIEADIDRINRLIGMPLENQVITAILKDLDFEVSIEGSKLSARVPTYRVDVTREADLAEEVLRIYGYNNIPFPEKLNASLSHAVKPDLEALQNQISDALVSRGFTEMMANSLTKPAYVEGLSAPELSADVQVKMLNPLSQDLEVLRQSLLFGGLEAIARNQNHFNPDLRLFEFGKTYIRGEAGYQESRRLALFVTGRRSPESWNTHDALMSYVDIKKAVDFLLERSGLAGSLRSEAVSHELWGEGMTCRIGRDEIVRFGSVPKALLKNAGIKSGSVFWADLDWDAFVNHASRRKVKTRELPKFPAVRRDLSLLINRDVTFAQLEMAARKSEKRLLKEVGLFDVFEDSDKLPENKKSYALNFILQDEEKTLTDKQIDKVMAGIQRALETECGAQLR